VRAHSFGSLLWTIETFNAGTSEAKGAELEFRWLPVDKLTVSATYGYLDSKFKNVYLPNASVYTLVNGQTVDLRDQSARTLFAHPETRVAWKSSTSFLWAAMAN